MKDEWNVLRVACSVSTCLPVYLFTFLRAQTNL